jgi:hypothetical protein
MEQQQQQDQATKVRENRVRRMATRQGYGLKRSRRRDRLALDYGEYTLIRRVIFDRHGTPLRVANPEQSPEAQVGPFRDLAAVEAYLTREDRASAEASA